MSDLQDMVLASIGTVLRVFASIPSQRNAGFAERFPMKFAFCWAKVQNLTSRGTFLQTFRPENIHIRAQNHLERLQIIKNRDLTAKKPKKSGSRYYRTGPGQIQRSISVANGLTQN